MESSSYIESDRGNHTEGTEKYVRVMKVSSYRGSNYKEVTIHGYKSKRVTLLSRQRKKCLKTSPYFTVLGQITSIYRHMTTVYGHN